MRGQERQPPFVEPMLLKSGQVPGGDGWALEIKWDGCRAQLRCDGGSVSLRTRNGRECSADFPELRDIAEALGKRRVTIDGELVCLRPDGSPDFARLRRRLSGSTRAHPAILQVFDVLHLDGRSTRALPYRVRRALLTELAFDGSAWRRPASIVVDEPDEFVTLLKRSSEAKSWSISCSGAVWWRQFASGDVRWSAIASGWRAST